MSAPVATSQSWHSCLTRPGSFGVVSGHRSHTILQSHKGKASSSGNTVYIAAARAYVMETASPGYTMTLQGAELAIGRLHPEFVIRLAPIREARSAGLPFAECSRRIGHLRSELAPSPTSFTLSTAMGSLLTCMASGGLDLPKHSCGTRSLPGMVSFVPTALTTRPSGIIASRLASG